MWHQKTYREEVGYVHQNKKKKFPLLKFKVIFHVLFLKWQSAFANSVNLKVFKKHATKKYVKRLKRIKTICKNRQEIFEKFNKCS